MIDAADFLKWLNIFNVPYSGHPGSEVVISWNGSTNPVDVTAGSGIDITNGIISLTGTGASVAYASLTVSNYVTVISYTNTTTWKPLVGDILDSSGVNFLVGNDNPDDPTSPFYLQYIGEEEGSFQIIASFSMRRFSSTTPNGYYLSASRDGINPIDFTISDFQVDYGLDGQNTQNAKSVTYNIQLDLIQNDKIYFVVRSANNDTSTDNDFLNTSNIISVQKVGDVGGTLAGVASLNGETGTINLTSSGNTIDISPSGSNINIDIVSPISISKGGTNATSQTTNGMNYFDGTSITSLPALTNGQIYIGSTGLSPVAATITPGTGITIANSTGIIIVSATGNGPYTELTSSVGIFSNHTYTANSASLITMTLPSTSSPGDYIKINYKGTGGWKIAQNSGQQIQYGTLITTSGTGGSLASSSVGNCVSLICITANTLWEVQSSQGNLTVV